MVCRVSRLFNRVLAILKRRDCHSFSEHFKPTDCQYLPARQLYLELLSNCCRCSRQFSINSNQYNALLQNHVMPCCFLSMLPMQNPSSICRNHFLRRTIILTMLMNFCFLHSWFKFSQKFIMLLLQCSESIDCRVKSVLNVKKGFTNLSL